MFTEEKVMEGRIEEKEKDERRAKQKKVNHLCVYCVRGERDGLQVRNINSGGILAC